MTHNTKISPRRLGPPRFPVDPEAQKPGELVVYYLPKEEIERRYGHLRKQNLTLEKKRQTNRNKLSKERLIKEFEKGLTAAQIAARYETHTDVILQLAELWGLELDEKKRLKNLKGGEGMTETREQSELNNSKSKMSIAREKLPKEKLAEELKNKTQKQIAEEYGFEPWVIRNLVNQYGLQQKKSKQKTEHVCTEPCEALKEMQLEIERLKEILKKVLNFAYSHRHQVGAGHYSEKGVV